MVFVCIFARIFRIPPFYLYDWKEAYQLFNSDDDNIWDLKRFFFPFSLNVLNFLSDYALLI